MSKSLNQSGNVNLHYAAALESEEKFITLLSIQSYDTHNDRCAALLQRDGYGRTALHYAVEAKHENKKTMLGPSLIASTLTT